MQRIPAVDPITASGALAETFATVRKMMGGVPNIFRTMGTAPAVLNAYLAFSGAIDTGKLPAKLREQIALVAARTNGCNYCASAHQALARMAGLSADDIARGYDGDASDAKSKAALAFAKAVLASRGQVSDAELAAAKAAGWTDEEVLEIVANVALNIFTNYFNNVADTAVDFPLVSVR